jgi:hypothetical protein
MLRNANIVTPLDSSEVTSERKLSGGVLRCSISPECNIICNACNTSLSTALQHPTELLLKL